MLSGNAWSCDRFYVMHVKPVTACLVTNRSVHLNLLKSEQCCVAIAPAAMYASFHLSTATPFHHAESPADIRFRARQLLEDTPYTEGCNL
jgi:hypothetical protein